MTNHAVTIWNSEDREDKTVYKFSTEAEAFAFINSKIGLHYATEDDVRGGE